MSALLLGRAPAFRGVRLLDAHPAPRQRLAQQNLDLGIGAAQLGGGQPLDRGVERRIETEGEGFLGGRGHWNKLSRANRPEERRGGKEGVSTCRSGWSPYHKKK